MAYTVVDNDVAFSANPQSDIFAADWQVLANGFQGIGVVSGLAVAQRGAGANMSVDIAVGVGLSGGALLPTYAITNVAVTAADATNPRVDIAVMTSAGALVVRAGTPAANPKPATLTAGDVALAFIYVQANASSITTANNLTDKRFILPTSVVAEQNAVINGGMDFFQRQAPATPTARTNNTYGPDRWVVLTQTAAVNCQRGTGNKAVSDALLTQNQAAAQRFGLIQWLENNRSKPYRSGILNLQFAVKPSTTLTVRYAILEWTGTADTLGAGRDVVNSWTNATFTAGQFFKATTMTITAVGSLSCTGGAWQSIQFSGSISASANNIAIFIWTDAAAATGVTLEVSEVDVCGPLATGRAWAPRPSQQELALCQRYYEKSYDPDVLPGTASANGYTQQMASATAASDFTGVGFTFATTKRAAPTVTPYDFAGNASKLSEVAAGGGLTNNIAPSSAAAVAFHGFNQAHDPAGNIIGILLHYTADSEL